MRSTHQVHDLFLTASAPKEDIWIALPLHNHRSTGHCSANTLTIENESRSLLATYQYFLTVGGVSMKTGNANLTRPIAVAPPNVSQPNRIPL
jgi:hypothetical protein